MALALACGFVPGVLEGARLGGPLPLPAFPWAAGEERAGGETTDRRAPGAAERAVLDRLFSQPLAAPDRQVHPPCHTLACVEDRLQAMTVESSLHAGAYEALRPTRASVADDVLTVEYRLGGRAWRALALVDRRPETGGCAALVLPGGGINQATAIHARDPDNYQSPVAGAVTGACDMYVLVRPNEDLLAIHDGRRKLGGGFVSSWMVNHGGAYAAAHLVAALAVAKHLRSAYPRLLVVGLSQGGAAALLTALQAGPDGAFVASGYSVLLDGFNQLEMPGLGTALRGETVAVRIGRSSTHFAFSWGRRERNHYGIEAAEGPTCARLGGLPNVDCVVHDDGHVYPQDALRAFVARHAAAPAVP